MKRLAFLLSIAAPLILQSAAAHAEITRELDVPKGKKQVIIDLSSGFPGSVTLTSHYLYRFCLKTADGDGKFVLDRNGSNIATRGKGDEGCFHVLVKEGDRIEAGTTAEDVDATFRLMCIENAANRTLCIE